MTRGHLDRIRGEINEERFFAIFERNRSLIPSWIFSIVKASKYQDAKGIDYIIETDIGRLYIQIKSSEGLIIKYKHKKGTKSQNLILLEINNKKSDNQILQNFISQANHLKKRFRPDL
jgi:hypothetical protein